MLREELDVVLDVEPLLGQSALEIDSIRSPDLHLAEVLGLGIDDVRNRVALHAQIDAPFETAVALGGAGGELHRHE